MEARRAAAGRAEAVYSPQGNRTFVLSRVLQRGWHPVGRGSSHGEKSQEPLRQSSHRTREDVLYWTEGARSGMDRAEPASDRAPACTFHVKHASTASTSFHVKPSSVLI